VRQKSRNSQWKSLFVGFVGLSFIGLFSDLYVSFELFVVPESKRVSTWFSKCQEETGATNESVEVSLRGFVGLFCMSLFVVCTNETFEVRQKSQNSQLQSLFFWVCRSLL